MGSGYELRQPNNLTTLLPDLVSPQLFMDRTLSALATEEVVSLKGSGMIKCGDELILCYTTAKVCARVCACPCAMRCGVCLCVCGVGGVLRWRTGAARARDQAERRETA